MIVRMTASRASIDRCSDLLGHRLGVNEPHAVTDQRVAGQDEKEQQALEHLSRLVGDAKLHLHPLSAYIADRQEDAREEHADGVQATEKGDDDRGEAVTGRDVRLQLTVRAGDFADAGQPGRGRRRA